MVARLSPDSTLIAFQAETIACSYRMIDTNSSALFFAGVLRSDCSPAQEDGAWSKEAAAYIDKHTNGLSLSKFIPSDPDLSCCVVITPCVDITEAHSQTMEHLQKAVDRAFQVSFPQLRLVW